MTKEQKRILSVTIIHQTDSDGYTSYYGEYSDTRSSKVSVDRQHTLTCAVNCEPGNDIGQDYGEPCDCNEGGSWNRNQYRFFNPSFNYINKSGNPTDGMTYAEARKYTHQDYERMEALQRGDWCFIGIKAVAEVHLTDGDSFRTTTQIIRSPGCWGIESDSGQDYITEVEQEELSNLKSELSAIGFSKRAIAAAFRNVKHSDD
jgi:hypothetical protein